MKKNTGMKDVKDLMKTSVTGMAGLGAVGAMNSIPGMPSNNIGSTLGAGVSIANLGGVAKIGMNIIPKSKSSGGKKKKY